MTDPWFYFGTHLANRDCGRRGGGLDTLSTMRLLGGARAKRKVTLIVGKPGADWTARPKDTEQLEDTARRRTEREDILGLCV